MDKYDDWDDWLEVVEIAGKEVSYYIYDYTWLTSIEGWRSEISVNHDLSLVIL